MRYYRILIGGQPAYSSVSPTTGATDPGALNIELDIISAPGAVPGGDAGARLQVWGIPLTTISQSSNFAGKSIQVYGGMSKGLPLANPAQQGLLVQGLIQQAWGNWIGTNQTLDFIITAGQNAPGTAATATAAGKSMTQSGGASITPMTPLNLIFNWPAGTPLSQAIQQTFQTALPGFTVNANISSKLVRNRNVNGFYQNIIQFSDFLQKISVDIMASQPYGGTGYRGVQVGLDGGTIKVFDNSQTPSNVTAIAFNDLIGQPTWRAGNIVQATCVMRGDLRLDSVVSLPQTQVTIAGSLGMPQQRDTSIFKGNFHMSQLRHVGNYKQPDAHAWVTVLDLYPVMAATAAAA